MFDRFEGEIGAGAGTRRSAGQQEDGHGIRVSLRHATKAFSAPGPDCIINTPMVLPFLILLNPSAM